MHFATPIALLTLFCGALAAPNLIKRGSALPTHVSEVQLCNETDFKGECYTFWSDKCVDLFGSTIGADFLNDNTRSIRMGPDTTCAFYEHPGCTGQNIPLPKDSVRADVSKYYFKKGWGERISSFQCYKAA